MSLIIHFILIYRGLFYDGYLKKIHKNTDPIDWKTIDISYLLKVYLRLINEKIDFFFSQDRYDPTFQALVDSCPVITVSDLAHLKNDMKCAQLRYTNEKEFVAIANTLQIMNDIRV